MWQQEVSNYHDEAYYLFNGALNDYMARLQRIYNRGMIESWIESEDIQNKSPWTIEKTLAYFEELPLPKNETESKIYHAGLNATKSAGDVHIKQPEPKVRSVAEYEFEPLLFEMAA